MIFIIFSGYISIYLPTLSFEIHNLSLFNPNKINNDK